MQHWSTRKGFWLCGTNRNIEALRSTASPHKQNNKRLLPTKNQHTIVHPKDFVHKQGYRSKTRMPSISSSLYIGPWYGNRKGVESHFQSTIPNYQFIFTNVKLRFNRNHEQTTVEFLRNIETREIRPFGNSGRNQSDNTRPPERKTRICQMRQNDKVYENFIWSWVVRFGDHKHLRKAQNGVKPNQERNECNARDKGLRKVFQNALGLA